jgi:hypothetical protein
VSWHQNCNALAKVVVRVDTGRGPPARQYRGGHLDKKYGDWDSDKTGANYQETRDDSLHLNNPWVRSICLCCEDERSRHRKLRLSVVAFKRFPTNP